MRRIVTLALAVAIAVTTAIVVFNVASPASARDQIVAAALSQKSVHWTGRYSGSMSGTRTFNADVSADAGIARETWGFPGTAQIRLVNGTVFVRADSTVLNCCALGLTWPQAWRYAGKWISIPKGDDSYARLADGLTLASIVNDTVPLQTSKSYTTTPRRARLLSVRGTSGNIFWDTSSSGRLVARGSGTPLPVSFSYVDVARCTRGRFSRWNESVNVEAPVKSTPIATVRGG